MTPRQFNYLLERYERRTKQEDRRSGALIAALYNIHTRTSETDTVHDWREYYPEWKEAVLEQTEDQMFEMMLLFTKQREGLSA